MAAGWEVILPFLKPIEALLRDPDVSDILMNAGQSVFFEKHGQMQRYEGGVMTNASLQVAARNIARTVGAEINEQQPLLDGRLPDGSRVAAALSDVSVDGTVIAIRKLQTRRYDLDELVRVGSCPASVLTLLRQAIEARWNVLIAGGTGTGKTTLLNALASLIPEHERLLVIEDTAEIALTHPNRVRFEARREQPGLPAVPMRDLLKSSLRFRPDRILVGEVRGAEAFELLQAMNTGHSGTLSTIHADSATETLTRLATCVMMAGVALPYAVVRFQIGESLDLVVHLERSARGRCVTEVTRVRCFDEAAGRFECERLYAR